MTAKDWIEIARDYRSVVGWLVGAIVFMVVFRKQIGEVLGRIDYFSFFGTKAQTRPPADQSPKAAKAATAEIKDTGRVALDRTEPTLSMPALASGQAPAPLPGGNTHSRLLAEVESNIRKDSKLAGLDDAAKVEVLLKHQAVAQVEVVFERLYRVIFGSQIRALRAAIQPVPMSVIQDFFVKAKAEFPEAHANRTFDEWIAFIANTGLGVRVPDQNGVPTGSITVLGQEFLMYLDRMGYREPWG